MNEVTTGRMEVQIPQTGSGVMPPRPMLASGESVSPIVPTTIEQVWRMSELIVAAKMAPESLKTVEQVAVAIMHGLEVGFTPMAALQSIAVVNGRAAIWGDGALALVRNSGLLADFEETLQNDPQTPTWIATCRVRRRGDLADQTRTFTWKQAVQASLTTKEIWRKYPDRMLQMRARAYALRDVFPDVLKGLHIREEVDDIGTSGGGISSPSNPPPAPPPAAGAPLSASPTQAPAAPRIGGGYAQGEVYNPEPSHVEDIQGDDPVRRTLVAQQPGQTESFAVETTGPTPEETREQIESLFAVVQTESDWDELQKEQEEIIAGLPVAQRVPVEAAMEAALKRVKAAEKRRAAAAAKAAGKAADAPPAAPKATTPAAPEIPASEPDSGRNDISEDEIRTSDDVEMTTDDVFMPASRDLDTIEGYRQWVLVMNQSTVDLDTATRFYKAWGSTKGNRDRLDMPGDIRRELVNLVQARVDEFRVPRGA